MYLPAGTALPYQIEIDADLNSDLPNLQTAVNYYALDSNTDPGDDNPDTTDYPGQIDDFMDDDNAETLWTLAFSSTGVTSGPGSIAVDFELNAASELSFSSQELSDLSCTGANDNDTCIDNAVDSELKADLISDGSGGEDLNDASLFQDAVTYTPSGSAGSTVEYGEGVAADVATVPEPPTIGLLLVSIAVLGILNRRHSLTAPMRPIRPRQ